MARKDPPRAPRPRKRRHAWANWTDEQILDLRLCDLDVHVEGTWLEGMVARLHEEMGRAGLRLAPHFWLSSEWFSPDGVPGVAIPFYLAHPRLMQIERRQVQVVEGGTREWCMRILRHEAGHAFDSAYRLRRQRAWQRTFGRGGRPYPQTYRPRPHSRNHVQHLEWWYAQSHPAEDFAETFAVWLRPGRAWERTYEGWPVMRKLRYLDALAEDLRGTPPPVRSRERVEPLRDLQRTLRAHYKAKRDRYGVDAPDFYDEQLARVFAAGRAREEESAAAFLRRVAPWIRRQVGRWTGQPDYTVDQFLTEMIGRCRRLRLRRSRSEGHARLEAAVLLTVQVMGYLGGGGRHVSL